MLIRDTHNIVASATKIDTDFINEKVQFLFTRCSLDKKYSFYSLTKEEAQQLVQRLLHLEQISWGEFQALDRRNGLTPEYKHSASFEMINEQNTDSKQYPEIYKHYFHFRVKQSSPFRVFGYQYKQFFCVTHLDPKGRVHKH